MPNLPLHPSVVTGPRLLSFPRLLRKAPMMRVLTQICKAVAAIPSPLANVHNRAQKSLVGLFDSPHGHLFGPVPGSPLDEIKLLLCPSGKPLMITPTPSLDFVFPPWNLALISAQEPKMVQPTLASELAEGWLSISFDDILCGCGTRTMEAVVILSVNGGGNRVWDEMVDKHQTGPYETSYTPSYDL
ncbi:hypothetical protein BJ138DRAFT_1102703 [Hygrophoropsis aurantiaca]|uniref:Uncharacterized protein n=1 Tax=Hygrophoropsis aurantiaca TaxID=72124 RepID=A0ACB8A7L4_9AGAM|nr:hypothetical protein BJ138DRAFT_1102703 [Hygrophoropsis aurantiaca]